MKKKTIAYLLGAAAVLCLAVGGFKLAREQKAGEEYEELREEVKTEAEEKQEEEAPVEEKAPLDIPVDFEALQAENPDIYAWITIPGTNVDYPILQREGDNGYYLNHSVDGTETIAGSIFTEDYNTKTFEDPNTIIYGHNMKNGSMFRTLHNYHDREFFDKNRDITIYMPDKILHYTIFAAYLYDSRHLMLSFDFNDPDVFRGYLDSVRNIRDMNAFVDTDIPVTENDKIITLSTCYKGQADRRYLVQAVLVSIES